MAPRPGAKLKKVLKPGGPKKAARVVSIDEIPELPAGAAPADGVVVDSAPVPAGGHGTGALPRSKKKTPAHIKAALDRALATSEGKEPPKLDTTGVDPLLVKGMERKEAKEAAEAGDPLPESLISYAKYIPVPEEASKGGRPSEYKTDYCALARRYLANGATMIELADLLGISTRTLNRWEAEHLEFRLATHEGHKENEDMKTANVKRSLYQNASGYHHRIEKLFHHKGEVLRVEQIEFVPGNVTAQQFYLANKAPEEFRHRPEPPTGAGNDGNQMQMLEMARAVAYLLGQGMQLQAMTQASVGQPEKSPASHTQPQKVIDGHPGD